MGNTNNSTWTFQYCSSLSELSSQKHTLSMIFFKKRLWLDWNGMEWGLPINPTDSFFGLSQMVVRTWEFPTYLCFHFKHCFTSNASWNSISYRFNETSLVRDDESLPSFLFSLAMITSQTQATVMWRSLNCWPTSPVEEQWWPRDKLYIYLLAI